MLLLLNPCAVGIAVWIHFWYSVVLGAFGLLSAFALVLYRFDDDQGTLIEVCGCSMFS